MQGKWIVMAIAALGWIVASLLAFVLVSSFTFFGVGLIGLLLWFVCVRMELEKDAAIGTGWTPSLIETQYRERQRLSSEQRAAWWHEQTLALQSLRFFRHLGMALTLIGAVGFGLFQI